MSDDCIFCSPKQNALIFKNDQGIVIVDDPIRVGHVLIGSRSHGESLHNISSEDAAALMSLAQRAATEIVRITGAAKTYVVAIGDKDKHFHVHLLPKFPSDPNLGPFVFGTNGWAGALASGADQIELSSFGEGLRQSLSC